MGTGIEPAWTGGSLSLEDVINAVKDVPNLGAEIHKELKDSGLNAEDVLCTAGRFGRHWKYLGGGRAAPYECSFGKRTLTIEAEQTYYDARGRSLGDIEKADPARARSFRERNFQWKWEASETK